MTLDERCGTYAGYQVHVRRKETPCDDCRAANSAYVTNRRHASAEVRRIEAEQQAARERARVRLAKMHPTQYASLYAEESAHINVPPRRERGTFV